MNEISNIDMEKPFFTPWIGENYFNGIDGTGIKVMVVGASHYCESSKKTRRPH